MSVSSVFILVNLYALLCADGPLCLRPGSQASNWGSQFFENTSTDSVEPRQWTHPAHVENQDSRPIPIEVQCIGSR